MKTSPRIISLFVALVALGALALASSAQASSLSLKCSGKGPQNKAQEYETAECAVAPGQKRSIEGVLRNNKNKLAAGTLKVTYSKWIPAGEGAFDITPEKTVEIKAAANGKFTVANVNTTSEMTVYIEAVESLESEISPVTQEVDIQRLVTLRGKVLGGGKVKVTVKGAALPVKVSIEDEGYPLAGGAARKVNKAGVAIFDLHGAHGTFGLYLEAGDLTDLYYVDSQPVKL
jgi:hypothetical protein